MSSQAEVGISPVLLQAITQTLSTGQSQRRSITATQPIVKNGDGQPDDGELVEDQIVEEPAALEVVHHGGGGDAHVHDSGQMQLIEEATFEGGDIGQQTVVYINSETGDGEQQISITEEQAQELLGRSKLEPGTGQVQTRYIIKSDPSSITTGNQSMGQVLSAIANHVKSSVSNNSPSSSVTTIYQDSNDTFLLEREPHETIVVSSNSTPSMTTLQPTSTLTPEIQGIDQMISETVVHTLNPAAKVIQAVEKNTNYKVIHEWNSGPQPAKQMKLDSNDTIQVDLNSGNAGENVTYVVESEGSLLQAIQTEHGTVLKPLHGSDQLVKHLTNNITPSDVAPKTSVTVSNEAGGTQEVLLACPICGDRVSGYHYGIYSCESCKGFFKRTVQNKKAFMCHRTGECDVNVVSRKKCPACRFKRCLDAGMKLEAIREDRTRGGRSSYDGATPNFKFRPAPKEPPVRKEPISRKPFLSMNAQVMSNIAGTSGATQQLQQPQTPQNLEDLLTLESLMKDGETETEQSCCEGKLREGDVDLFASLLHIADHCLYRIVRWARNLPEFSNISTDDQILLLQNCWAELLCITICWHSARGPNPDFLHLGHGRRLDAEQAASAGVYEVMNRLLDFTNYFRRLEIDSHEFVGLKAIVLMTPDVKGIGDPNLVREYQEKITESLLVHTATHYPEKTGKHCELLARLPELSRSCVLAKELLSTRQQTGEVPQYSLLSELLKGDMVAGMKDEEAS